MNDDNNFRVSTSDGDSALDQRLSDELDAYNVPAADAGQQREFTAKVENEISDLVGGLSGWTWGTSAGTAMVGVRQDQRRSGHGACLLEAAESIARERACERVNVSSFTFQAPVSTRSTATSRSGARRHCPWPHTPTCTS